MAEIGTISTYESGVDLVVEWKIEDFFKHPEKNGAFYFSPYFSFDAEEWWLTISPNGSIYSDCSEHVDLRLSKRVSGRPIKLPFSLSLKTVRGGKYNEQHVEKDFDNDNFFHIFNRFIPRSELSRRISELVPEGVLTVVCTVKNLTSAGNTTVGKLLQDLKRIMVSGDHSDMTISVRGEEIRLHGSILRARNHFFDSRPNNESHKSTPDTLTINDCDPDQFCTLIHYIYTRTVDNLCPENVCGLFDVAVTCQEQQMKAKCLQLMTSTLSVDNFCEYTALAVKHDQEELLQKATELFVRKAKQITRHKKWEVFLERYPVQANKLYMKALDQYDENEK